VIDRLRKTLAEARTRKAELESEMIELAVRLPEIRAAFGNPFFYSHPEHTDESAANYTSNSSHEVVLPTILGLRRIDRELRMLQDRLRRLGVNETL
jgi:hypothetical protein